MPFDASGFPPKPPEPPRRSGPDLGAVLVLIISLTLLMTPLSLAACTDVWRFMSRTP